MLTRARGALARRSFGFALGSATKPEDEQQHGGEEGGDQREGSTLRPVPVGLHVSWTRPPSAPAFERFPALDVRSVRAPSAAKRRLGSATRR